MLTLDCSDYTVAIFYQLFEKFAGSLQLQFITLESLPEVRTVQIALAKLQRRMPHLLDDWLLDNRDTEFVLLSHAAYVRLQHTGHFSSTHSSVQKGGNHGVHGSLQRPLVTYEEQQTAKKARFKFTSLFSSSDALFKL